MGEIGKTKKIFLLSAFFFIVFFASVRFVEAANLYVVLDKTSVSENETVSASVYVNTQGVSVNNAESAVIFPANLLAVESVNTVSSIFSLWVEQPTFSNINGTVSFNGGVPNPGYTGFNGKILQINFRAKKTGTAVVSFSSPAVRANDGFGTNVLQGFSPASISVLPYKGATDGPAADFSDNLPSSPTITSEDVSDPEVWYSVTSAIFSWALPSGVTEVQLLIGKFPDSLPTVSYSPPIKNKKLNDLTDGVWYLHARFRNANGYGNTAHRKIKIDTTSPKNLSVTGSVTDDNLVALDVSADDDVSGINSYKVYSDNRFITEIKAANTRHTKFTLPPHKTGNVEYTVKAFDRAGNFAEKAVVVSVPDVLSPKIISYPENIKKGERFEIEGLAPFYGADITIFIQEENQKEKSYSVKAGSAQTSITAGTVGSVPKETLENKKFTFTSDYMQNDGLVVVWAVTNLGNNVVSPPSEKVYIVVKKPAIIVLSKRAIEILSVAIPVVILFLLLLAVAYIGFHRLRKLRQKLRKDLFQTEKDIHKIFKILKGDTKKYLRIIEKAGIKRKLTEEEDHISKQLSDDIEEAEKYFADRIKKIEKKDL